MSTDCFVMLNKLELGASMSFSKENVVCIQKSYSHTNGVDFGLIFDIDGVIVRGKDVIKPAQHAFRLLTNAAGEFRVPTCFVTNAGNNMRQIRAAQLSRWLGVEVCTACKLNSYTPVAIDTY